MGKYNPQDEIIYNDGILMDIGRIINYFEVSEDLHDELANNYMDNYFSKDILEKLEIEKLKYSNEYFKSVVTDFIDPLIETNHQYFKKISNSTLNRVKSWLLDKFIVDSSHLKGLEVSTEKYVYHKYLFISEEFKEIEGSPEKFEQFENHLREELSSNHWKAFKHIWRSYKAGKINKSDLFSKGFETIGEEVLMNNFDINNILVRFDFADKDKGEYNNKLKQQSDLVHDRPLKRKIKLPNDGNLGKISPDGTLLLCRENNIIRIIDFEEGVLITSLPRYQFMGCSFTYDNNHIVFAHFPRMLLWNMNQEKIIWKIDSKKYKEERNFYVKVTPDDRYIVSSGDFLTVRDLKTAKEMWSIRNPLPSNFVITNDSKFILIRSIDKVKVDIWDLLSGELVKNLFLEEKGVIYDSIPPNIKAISHNNKYIAISLNEYSDIWKISKNLIHILNLETEGNYLEIEFSPDDKYLAITDITRKIINVWELSTRKITCKLKHEYKINFIKFIPNTHSLLSSTYNGYIFIWDYLFDASL